MRRLSGEETNALAALLTRKVRILVWVEPGEDLLAAQILQTVVDTEMVVAGDVPLECWLEEAEQG